MPRFTLGLATGLALALAASLVASEEPLPGIESPPSVEAAADPPAKRAPGRAPERGALGPCEVFYVVDGDTVDVDCSRVGGPTEQRVRLLRIDTPERGEPGFRRSTTALAKLLLGKDVYLVHERPGRPETDRYDRLLAYLFADGLHVNVEMVRRGWTPFWRKYGAGRFARDFRSAEQVAVR